MPPARKRNSAADQEFIAKRATEFRVVDGLLVWSGLSEDIGSPWQLPPDDMRCTNERQIKDDDGNPVMNSDLDPLKVRCPKWAIINSHICIEHARGSATVQSLVRERLLGVADVVSGGLYELAMDKKVAPGDRIKAINSILDRVGIRPGFEIGGELPLFQQALKEMFGERNEGGEENERPEGS